MNRLNETAGEQINRVETYTRETPLAALSIAAAIGYAMRSLPLFALARFFLQLALMLVRPFIFIFGAVNLYHFFKGRADSAANFQSPEE